jgi:hypothetical protein
MWATLSRNAFQTCGPQAPCGLASKARSLGDKPPAPVSVADGTAGPFACKALALLALALLALALLFAIGAVLPRQRGTIEDGQPAPCDRICGNCPLKQQQNKLTRSLIRRPLSHQRHPDSAAWRPHCPRARQLF